jgi:hypothetical protein
MLDECQFAAPHPIGHHHVAVAVYCNAFGTVESRVGARAVLEAAARRRTSVQGPYPEP